MTQSLTIDFTGLCAITKDMYAFAFDMEDDKTYFLVREKNDLKPIAVISSDGDAIRRYKDDKVLFNIQSNYGDGTFLFSKKGASVKLQASCLYHAEIELFKLMLSAKGVFTTLDLHQD